ncbi:MAG: hypothetical protein JXR96_01030 [Deltaproteobacteria bacterium]|nr:hypothetical protein [Deltaproteobacteria bacterium]
MGRLQTAALAGLLLVSACSSSSTFEGECKRDSDCATYERCDTRDYRCVCATDEACAQGEFCNPLSGSCQVKPGCYSNADCEPGSYCDVETGECISSLTCTRDYQCDLGHICVGGKCELGCRDSADCELYRPDGPEICVDGQCRFGMCDSHQQCQFGYICDPESHSCVAPEAPYCEPGCDPICEGCTDKNQGPCGDPGDICAGNDPVTFCWVACEDEADCPSGYHCVPTTATWAICSEDIDCASVVNTCGQTSRRCMLNQQPCDTDLDCHDFMPAICLSRYCVFGYHCEPAGGCPSGG